MSNSARLSSSTMRCCSRRWCSLVQPATRPRTPSTRRFHTIASPLRGEEASLISCIVRTYQNGIQKYPLFTKVIMAVFIFTTSDVVTQKLLIPPPTTTSRRKSVSNDEEPDETEIVDSSQSKARWDASRTLSAAVFGVASTTFLHYWWGLLEHSFASVLPMRHTHFIPTLAKVFVHQSCAAPFYIYSYYVLTNFVQQVLSIRQEDDDGTFSSTRKFEQIQQSWHSVHAKAQEMLWPTMLRHWSVWPFVQTANFYCISLHHRILVHNSVLMLWSGYLSYLNHHDQSSLRRNRSLFHDLYHYSGIWVSTRRERGCENEDCTPPGVVAAKRHNENDNDAFPPDETARATASIATRKSERGTLPTT